MRNGLRILAGLCAVAILAVWIATGAHTGWTKTQVTTMQLDPITELEYPETKDRFVAGVDAVGGGLLLSLALLAVSFAFKRQPTTH